MTGPVRVFSGIQPSGEIHIGNYLGAVKKWVEIAAEHESIFCIVDEHAITVDHDPKRLPTLTFEAARTAIACGLEPDVCTLFVQSHVPQHTELTWIFNTVTPLGSLFRMTQFKEKSRNALQKAVGAKKKGGAASVLHQLKNLGVATLEEADALRGDVAALDPKGAPDPELVERLNDRLGALMQQLLVGLGVSEASAGLFGYPVLQAADILLYKASLVPVGEDQRQHLELSREIAERFNRRFGEVFPLPQRVAGEAPRILGLDGRQKMSKSLDNHIGVLDAPELIEKKLSRAVSDPQRVRKDDPGRPEVCNVYSLHQHFTGAERREEIGAACRAGRILCFECKKELAGEVAGALAPIRERAAELDRQPEMVREMLAEGARRCRGIAEQTMEEVRAAVGIGATAISAQGADRS